MVCHQQNVKILLVLALAALICALRAGARADTPLPHRVFASSRFRVDKILARPYDRDVPFGASGDRVWATSPQGWGFRDGVQLIYITNLSAFDPVVRSGGTNYVVSKAEYMPSHVHMIGAPGSGVTASASFTYTIDNVDNPLTKPFKPEKRWTCWSSGRRTDWYAVDLGRLHWLTGFDLYFYDDQPEGGCAPPESVHVDLFRDGVWIPVVQEPFTPKPGKNTLRLDSLQTAEQVRLTFHHRGKDRYTGLYGFEPHFWAKDFPAPKVAPAALKVTGDKWITQDDVLVSRIEVENLTRKWQDISIRMNSMMDLPPTSGRSTMELNFAAKAWRMIQGFPLSLTAMGSDGERSDTQFTASLGPGESRTYTFALAVAAGPEHMFTRLDKLLALHEPLKAQIRDYQGWFDRNVAYFDCSDPLVAKMYYHRWYNLKKNSMNPQMGALKHRTFSEGRWTADWYANVISYGAAHQIRESRWLRDPSYAWGHLQTWTDNPRPDGIYPSHVDLKGQEGGQYTDWITASAWDAYLVHPDKPLLGRIADTLARNAEGWRKVYGWGDSPLLVVDSHWWTGMEWQPSFFSFADYHTEKPQDETHLRRVDLTAYNFGNAQAVANIYRELGRAGDAERLQKLADETRAALLAKMWDDKTHWFHSLRCTDDVKAPAKEVIGLYPFYFELPPAGKGYEAAWSVALDPALFWTPWPLASAARDCPAYAQNGWPVGGFGGSACMWNGPSWPHANSIVLTAMANVLRHYAPCAVTRQKLLELFDSFTRVQFRDQNPLYPWTGEYYHGETSAWKTEQRDYNHSTWIDPLIRDLLGLVPRPDDILEIDPLLPDGAWTHWVLDGQAYRGHDVTIAYDAQGGHVARGFRGFAVYLDGKRIYHADRPAHLLYDMRAGRLLNPRLAALGPEHATSIQTVDRIETNASVRTPGRRPPSRRFYTGGILADGRMSGAH